MGLLEQAEKDLGTILENNSTGGGWPIILTNPQGESKPFIGFSDDIAQVIDPDTGQAISGRLASIALRISSLYAEDFKLPQGIADTKSKPWIVEFNDINGLPYKFTVSQSNPDRTIGLVTCILETYK